MARFVLLAAVALCISAGARAQTHVALGESAKAMLGKWEFSNAEHDKVCTAIFADDRSGPGSKIVFDADCANLFPLVREIAGWKYPPDDLLYLLDAKGRALMTFSEVEDGIFEAPTPGLGLLFLQNSPAAPKQKSTSDVAGNWAVIRGDGPPACVIMLATDGLAVSVQPGCDPAIAKLNFAKWHLDRDTLLLEPTQGEPWRFEEIDGNWRRLSETAEPVRLERK